MIVQAQRFDPTVIDIITMQEDVADTDRETDIDSDGEFEGERQTSTRADFDSTRPQENGTAKRVEGEQ